MIIIPGTMTPWCTVGEPRSLSCAGITEMFKPPEGPSDDASEFGTQGYYIGVQVSPPIPIRRFLGAAPSVNSCPTGEMKSKQKAPAGLSILLGPAGAL